MENKTIIDYDRLPLHFKQRLAMKFSQDKTLIDLTTKDGKVQAIEIWYNCTDYVVPLNQRTLGVLEWDSNIEKDCDEAWESYDDFKNSDEFRTDLEHLFFS
ncbi:MAG: hypothetical protein ACI8ZM_004156 [Crocinitomix sp.]|jgi:uncharacterized protein YuzE